MDGKLLINILDRATRKPLAGIKIDIYKKDGESTTKVIENLETNANGQTPEVSLFAPDFAYSQTPDQPQPYSEYIVEVKADGYIDYIVDGVQIYPGELAIQTIYLEPVTKRSFFRQNQTVVIIGPNTLFGNYPPKIPEDPIKEELPPTGFVVLDYPQVPEFIIVHDGVPDDSSAANYWVRFKDYIKNVASSEIYSTWPDSTLRANICCIVSFTLNRVFTEWYRGKGYNFTITSSTAYDHKYIHNRNIYSNISLIVDEIFNLFVRRPEFRQPLLTQYCDGINVQCPNWLSQWGSKYRGDEGMSFDEILKYYYGSNLEFDRAPVVTGVPQSYPGYDLTIGSSGNEVASVQRFLNAIANNFPAIPKVKVSGYFDDSTADAVKAFQEIFGLPPNGIIDFPTWYKISDVYVGVSQIAELR